MLPTLPRGFRDRLVRLTLVRQRLFDGRGNRATPPSLILGHGLGDRG